MTAPSHFARSDDPLSKETVPLTCLLDFPSFPRQPPTTHLESFENFSVQSSICEGNIQLFNAPFSSSIPRGIPLVYVPRIGHINNSILSTVQHQPVPRETVNRDGLVCVSHGDAWKIGDAKMGWEEPAGTSVSDYRL